VLAVHAVWSPGRGVLLWAEDGERPTTTSSRSLRSARPHPFAVPSSELTALHPGKPTSLTLLLPSRQNGPLSSPELVRSGGRAAGTKSTPVLRPWSIPALVIDPAELADPDGSVRYGASAAHLRALAELADELAGRGRVLPTLVRSGGNAWARWRPVVQGIDRVRLESLVSALPPVGRAEHTGGALGGADPEALVTDALHTFVDAAVRDRLARADVPVALGGGGGPVEVWLAGLQRDDARVDLPPSELALLAEAVAAWDEVGEGGGTEGRACVRLAEIRALDDSQDHTGDGSHWQLQFLLQSSIDPSLLVSAEQVWSGQAGRLIAEPEQVLLAELGRAAVVVPMLAPALRRAKPGEYDITVAEAHEFLTHGAALLVEAGFGVQLPASWDGGRRLGLTLSARSTPTERVVTRGGLGREELADFRWSIAVGDEELGEEELAELVAAKAPLVRLRGKWVSVDPERLKAGLEFLQKDPRRAKAGVSTAAELLALAHTVPDEWAGARDLPLPVTGIRADGWIGDVLAGRVDATVAPVELPESFQATLRPYQERGVAWLAFLSALGLGACLADDMGLGKTVQMLALEASDRAEGSPGPTLLVCPMSLVGTWQREAAKFAPHLRVYAHHGSGRDHGPELTTRVAESDLVVTTYSTAARDAEELEAIAWHRLVLDEAQAVKNTHASAARAVRRFAAGHRVALTGTPVENRLAELWSVMDVVNPGLLGQAERFRQRFAIPIERHGDTEAAGMLRRITQPYLLRRVKTDPSIISDLPEKIEITQHYRLTREQASLYRTIVEDMMERIEDSMGIQRRGNVLAAMTKLKQVCNHPAQLLHDGSPMGRRSGKIIRLEEILGEILDAGDRVLCFTQFAEFGHMLVPHLSARFDTDVAFLHGSVAKPKRDAMVERFQSGEGPPILLLSLKAGGTGLTLTSANHVVHLDRWWNPAVENQATDRAFRIGQKRSVQVRKFVCPGTVEERIDTMITKKQALAGMVVGDGEQWLGELSTESLREVFALGEEATEDA
jgi:hypothetical protein